MTVVNQINRLEKVVPPDELRRFETMFPHILREMQGSQTLISQLVIRVGGSGPGTDTTDLDALTEDVEAISDEVADLQNQDQEALIASLSGRVSELENRLHAIESDFSADTRALDAIEDLRRDTPIDRYHELLSRIQALEAQI